ncbi:MAG: hypothetical protein LBE31_06895 [Deltaproteobacteria bacterium]|nr:hypothetical protein [Deltaproteobacteria bacterium]
MPFKTNSLSNYSLLLGLLVFLLFIFSGCSYPQRFENGLSGLEAPTGHGRLLILTFERESDFSPLAHQSVTVAMTSPGAVKSPIDGQGLTDSNGQLTISVSTVAVYDKSALKTGDVVVEYPVDLLVTLKTTGQTYQWDLDARQSFARYRDPLYRGLNRDLSPEPLHLTLTVP